jgi:hypothetical protein
LLACLGKLWRRVPRSKPLSVGVVLLDLMPAASAGATSSSSRNGTNCRINHRYGRGAIGFGLLPSDVRAFTGDAAFHRVPEA